MSTEPPPDSYWRRPENDVRHRGFWRTGAGWPRELPKGAATRTARGSWWLAWLWTGLTVLGALLLILSGLSEPLDWLRVPLQLAYLFLAAMYWRSWRRLRRHEAGRNSTPDPEAAPEGDGGGG